MNIYIYSHNANIYVILTIQTLNGMFLFPYMGMVYEELISRLNPRYLLTVSVIMMIGITFVNFVTTSALGLLFSTPSKQLTIQLMWCMSLMYIT